MLHQTFLFCREEPRSVFHLGFPPTCRLFGHQEGAAVGFFNFARKTQVIVLLCGAAIQRTLIHITAKTWITEQFVTGPLFFVLFLSLWLFFVDA